MISFQHPSTPASQYDPYRHAYTTQPPYRHPTASTYYAQYKNYPHAQTQYVSQPANPICDVRNFLILLISQKLAYFSSSSIWIYNLHFSFFKDFNSNFLKILLFIFIIWWRYYWNFKELLNIFIFMWKF